MQDQNYQLLSSVFEQWKSQVALYFKEVFSIPSIRDHYRSNRPKITVVRHKSSWLKKRSAMVYTSSSSCYYMENYQVMRKNLIIKCTNVDHWEVPISWIILSIFTFQADLGQEEDFEAARQKALKLGASKVTYML